MSKEEIIEQLPTLSVPDRLEIRERIDKLNDADKQAYIAEGLMYGLTVIDGTAKKPRKPRARKQEAEV